MNPPTEDFIRLVATDLLGGKRFTPAIKEQFAPIKRRAFEQLIGERINERLKGAMSPDAVLVSSPTPATAPPASEGVTPEVSSSPQVITSPEQIEAFYSVRAIVRDLVGTKRVFMRDAQSYCAILLDDNNRKTVCRLRFNNIQKLKIGLFNEKKRKKLCRLSRWTTYSNFQSACAQRSHS